jgi:hypothetical protein
MKNNQKGISLILTLFIILIVALIGAVVLYYYTQERPITKVTEKSEIPINDIQTTTENVKAATGQEPKEENFNQEQPIAEDIERKIDIVSISSAMEMYYINKSNYFQSKDLPVSISSYLNPVPQDSGDGPCPSYKWISNINDSQKYCVWACLTDGKFYVANQKGVTSTDKAPVDLNCY